MTKQIDEEIDKIVNHVVVQIGDSPNGSGGEVEVWIDGKETPLKQVIKDLLKANEMKARVDEVNIILRYVEFRHTADGATISAHYLYRQARKRIDELKKGKS